MPCVDNKDLIYNIKELPETFSVGIGDLLIIETDEGTNIMDFNNFVIGLDNTTFGTTITQNVTDIATLSANIESLSAAVDSSVATISSAIEDAGFGSDTALLSSTGYQILPSGLIMQWGVTERTTAFQGEQEITFATPFPNACLNLVGTVDYPAINDGNLSVYVKEIHALSATFIYDSDKVSYPDAAIRWQAFGH